MTKNPEATAIALLRVATFSQYSFDESLCVWTDLRGPSNEPLGRPLTVVLMVFRSVFFERCALAGQNVANVACDTLATQENLYGVAGGAYLDFAAAVMKGNTVPALIESDVVVSDVHRSLLNVLKLIVIRRQRFEGRLVDFFESRQAGARDLFERTSIELR